MSVAEMLLSHVRIACTVIWCPELISFGIVRYSLQHDRIPDQTQEDVRKGFKQVSVVWV